MSEELKKRNKREMLAAQFLAALMSNGGVEGHLDGANDEYKNIEIAFRYADAFIATLNQQDND